MADLNKFSIESGEQGFTLKISEKTDITDKELADVFSEQDISRIQEIQLAKKKEQYEQLKPAGFKFATEKAKKYRQKLEAADDDVEQMKHLSTILTYNQDNTVGLPKIKETFCVDLAGGRKMNRKDSMKVAKSKGYDLLSDWNDKDSEADKKETDWYRLENIFGEYANQGALFCMLGFDKNLYWTSTKYEDTQDLARIRKLNNHDCHRYGDDIELSCHCICGFKHSI